MKKKKWVTFTAEEGARFTSPPGEWNGPKPMKNTGPSQAVRQLVIDRKNHLCARCVMPGEVIHHRRPRKKGGTSRPEINSPENLIYICNICHEYIESHRTESYETGWLVKEGVDGPLEIPLIDLYGRTFYLFEDGGIEYMREAL